MSFLHKSPVNAPRDLLCKHTCTIVQVYLMGAFGMHEASSFQHSFLLCYQGRTSLPNFPIFSNGFISRLLLPSFLNFRPQLDVTAELKKSVRDLGLTKWHKLSLPCFDCVHVNLLSTIMSHIYMTTNTFSQWKLGMSQN